MKKNLLFILLIIFLSLPAILPLTASGFFQSDDGTWMIIRFSAFHEVLRSGEFPVRFLSRLNYGYGYPVANFLYPGFMYLAEIPKVLGFGFISSIKIILGLSLVFSAVFTFLWLSKLFSRLGALIGGIFYLYSPYHLYDIYKRGSVGEVLALSIVPFVLWQIERKSLFWTTVGIGFLLIAHNTLAFLALALIVIYLGLNILIAKHRRMLVYQYLSILALGFGLASFFWLPAIFDLQYTVFSKTSVSDVSTYFANKELVGIPVVFVFILTVALFLTKKLIVKKHRLTISLFVIGVLSLFLSTEASRSLWSILPSSFIQFPFRFLSITILCVSFLASVAVSILPKNAKSILVIVILVLVVISAKKLIAPAKLFDKGESFYSTNQDTTTVKNEYMPKWVKESSRSQAKEMVEVVRGSGLISNLKTKANKINFLFASIEKTTLRINKVYFPGWIVRVDGQKFPISYDNKYGTIEITVDSGSHDIKASFRETPIRLFADGISIVSFGALLFLKLKKKHEFS